MRRLVSAVVAAAGRTSTVHAPARRATAVRTSAVRANAVQATAVRASAVRATAVVATAVLAVAILAIASAAPARVAAAVIEGTVELPKREAVPVAKPRYPVSASYEIGDPDPPAAIVYLEGEFGDAGPAAGADVAQRQYQFTPGLVAVRKGATVRFPNLDDEYHSVFSYSKTKSFDLGRYRKDEAPAVVTFDRPGVVKLYCEIHDHMRGTILVLDTPYFTKTDGDGRYRLEDLPAGRYVLKAWVDDETVYATPVELTSDAVLRVDFAPSR